MLSHRVNLKYYYFRLSLPIILLIMFSILKSSFGRPASIDSDQELTEDRGYPNKLLINNNNNNNQSKLFKFCCPNSGSQNIEYPDKHKLTIKRNKSNSNNSNMNKNNNDKNQFNNNTSNHVNNDKNKTIKVSSPTMTTSPDINNIPLPRQSSSNGNNNVVFEEQRSLSLTSESSLFSNSNIISNNIIMNETNEPILKHQSSINSITEDMDHDYVYNENLYEEDNNKHLLINDKENKSDNNKQQKVDHQIEHQIEHNIEGHIEQHQHFEEKHHRQEQMNHPKISKQCTKLSQSASISNKKKVQQKLMALQLPQINIDPFDDDYKQDPIIDDIDPFQDDFSSSFTRSRSNGLPNIDNINDNINNNNGDDYLGKYQPDDQSQNIIPSTTQAVDSDDFDDIEEDDDASSIDGGDYNLNQNNIDYYVDEQGDCQYHLPFQYIMQHNDDDGDMNHHNYMYMNHHPHQLQSNQQQQQHQQQHPFIEQQHETHSNSHSHQIQPTHSQHLKHVQFYPQQIIHQQEFYGISNNDNNTEEIEHIEHIEQINDILPRQQSNHRQLSDSNKSNVSNQSYSSSSKPSINHSNSNPNSNPYYPNFNSFSSDDNGNKNISDTDKYQQDIQSLPSSLFKNQLDWNVILHLLNNKDDVLTALLKNNIQYKQNDNDDNEEDNDLMINKNDTLDSTDTVVDNEEQYESKYDNIQYDANNNNKQWPYDNDNDDLKDIDDDPSATNIMFDLKDQLEKYSFVARYNNELVFVKITKTDQYREKLILNIKKNEMLSSWWNDTDDDTDDLDEMPPFLQLRGWYLDDCSPLACIMYPFATKFSQYLNNQIIRNSDFAAFEKFENKEEQNKINWSVNDYHMDNIRNILSKLAIFIANLHAEDVSHRGITMDNLFIDNNIHKQQIYLINYAQNRFVDDLYLSPEGHQCKKNDDLSYSLTANDVWSFGCILLNIFGTNSNQYIQDFINYPYLLYNPNEVQRRLQLCLGIKDFSNQYEQTKLKSLLVLLLNIFTTENQRVDIEFVCQHPFLCKYNGRDL